MGHIEMADIKNMESKTDAIKLAQKYFDNKKLYLTDSADICEHLDVLKKYASHADHIIEIGVRTMVSTWAFILGRPKKLISVDILSPSHFLKDDGCLLNIVEEICEKMNIDFEFILGSSLEITLEETDLLFIDTDHTYNQLIQELNLHGNKSKKWIILHDTESCKNYIKNSLGVMTGGMQDAIDEFLFNNKQWCIKDVYTNNNGLTILERNA